MGSHGLGEMNDKGESLIIIEFCSLNNLVVTGTIFQHKKIHYIKQHVHNKEPNRPCDGQQATQYFNNGHSSDAGADIASDIQLNPAKKSGNFLTLPFHI